MAIRFQFRRGTAAEWTAANPTLAEGEFGLETDTDQFKVGDGSTAWTSLSYGGIVGPTGAQGADGGFDSEQTVFEFPAGNATYTIGSADAGVLLLNTDALTITIDDVLAVGQQVDFLQNSANQITFAAGSGVTLNSKDGNLKTAAQYSPASVKCVASGVYVLVGDLGA